MSGYDSTFEPEAGEVDERRWQLRPLSQATPRQTRWLVRGLIPLRFLTLVAGVGGARQVDLPARRSRREGSVADEPWDTIYVSFEDTADEVLRPRIEAAGGDPARVHELVLTDAELARLVQPPPRHRRTADSRPRVLGAARRHRPGRRRDRDQARRLQGPARPRRCSRSYGGSASEEDCAVALVGHLNRLPSTDAYLRIANSMAFWNAARSVVLVTEDGDEENGLRLIAQRKANLAALAPVERHRLEEIVLPGTVDPESGKPIVTSRMTLRRDRGRCRTPSDDSRSAEGDQDRDGGDVARSAARRRRVARVGRRQEAHGRRRLPGADDAAGGEGHRRRERAARVPVGDVVASASRAKNYGQKLARLWIPLDGAVWRTWTLQSRQLMQS